MSALIPRDVLFGNPEKVSPQSRPTAPGLPGARPGRAPGLGQDGRQGRRQGRHRRQEARHPPVLLGRGRQQVLYLQDSDGDENFHVYGVDLATRQRPRPHAVPGRAGADRRRPTATSPTRSWSRSTCATAGLSTSTASTSRPAARRLDTENPGDVVGWVADPEFRSGAAQAVDARRRDRDPRRGTTAVAAGGADALAGPEETWRLRRTSPPTAQAVAASPRWAATRRPSGARSTSATGDREGRGRGRPRYDVGGALIAPRTPPPSRPWLRPRPQRVEGARPRRQGRLRGDRQGRRRRLASVVTATATTGLAGRLHLRPRADPLLRLGPRREEGRRSCSSTSRSSRAARWRR